MSRRGDLRVELTLDIVRAPFETNVFGLLRLTQLVLPGMRAAGEGRIVNMGSMGGKLTFPGGGVYHATKYAVEALSDALRFEVQGFGVKVVLVEPGLITTEFATTAVASVDSGATGASGDEGPYARFNRSVRKGTAAAHTGPMSKLGGPPEAVAKVVHKALTTSRPRARYTVTRPRPGGRPCRPLPSARGAGPPRVSRPRRRTSCRTA
ncbi:hypothetical protein GCM10009815_17340 [Nocardioides marmoribigeumensis]